MASGCKGERKMECKDILNLMAIVVPKEHNNTEEQK